MLSKHFLLKMLRQLFLYKYNILKNCIHIKKFLMDNLLLNKILKKRFFIQKLKDIRHVKGRKIIFKLPLHAQRTHTNAQTTRRLFSKNKI